jgi:phosphoglycerate dehydrogenase-like enzyme
MERLAPGGSGPHPGSFLPVTSSTRRAAISSPAFDIVCERVTEDVEIVEVDDRLDWTAVDFLVPPSARRDLLEGLPHLGRLAVIQTLSAGTDWIEDLLPPQATLCNARGARDAPVAEWVLGALLGASTGLLEFAGATAWDRTRDLEDLGSWTVLIVGMGSIGRRLARCLKPIGTRVIGVGSRAHDDLHGPDELPHLLPAADAVVLLAPLTEATHHLIDAAALSRMRDGSVLVNAARGAVVDTGALTSELADGRLRAVLDVVDPEPLPDGHRLWQARGLLSLTPHIAGDSPAGHARAAELAADQLTRWCRGEELRNVVRRGHPGNPPAHHGDVPA